MKDFAAAELGPDTTGKSIVELLKRRRRVSRDIVMRQAINWRWLSLPITLIDAVRRHAVPVIYMSVGTGYLVGGRIWDFCQFQSSTHRWHVPGSKAFWLAKCPT